MLKTENFKVFIKLEEEKKNLKNRLKKIEEEKKEIQEELIDNLLDNDMSKISIAGKTVYINSIIRASIKSRDEAIIALKEAGYGDYVKENINANSVSALLRELIQNKEEGGEDLPPSFKDVITPNEIIDLRVVAA